MIEKILTKNFGIPDIQDIDVYEKSGGYKSLKKAFNLKPATIIEEIKKSNLRGRGGAGFSTGAKWSFITKESQPRYLVVNADEGEPGTFKDHALIKNDPHQLIEGCIITAWAIEANKCYIYIRKEFEQEAQILEKAIKQAKIKGYIGKHCLGNNFALDIIVQRGAGAYICGEETALLNSLEGKRGIPRLKPPFPAIKGFDNQPTIINNVETISAIPVIIEKGSIWFSSLGVPEEGGTRIVSVSGEVNNPGIYEIKIGTNLKKIIYELAGIPKGKKLKAVFPGGSSTPVLSESEINVSYSIDELIKKNSMTGSGAIIVMSNKTCMVWIALRLARFYHHESCGQCSPCREGIGWLEKILTKIENGKAKRKDIDLIKNICKNISGRTICPLGDAAVLPINSIITKFENEFLDHINNEKCSLPILNIHKLGLEHA